MIKILEIGIPVYKAKQTLPALLDSLVAQTRKNFIVCLSIDGDNEDYSELIQIYQNRGLKFRLINANTNGGPGVARQRVLDSTQCEFIMFADADDILLPRAVEVLYRGITSTNYDILRSSFIRETSTGKDMVLQATSNIVTWFHGKIYRVSYLKRINLSFLPDLRTDEDAYFNIIAWNGTESKGYVDEITYIWRDNPKSITRGKLRREYFTETHMNYISGQARALKKIYELNHTLDDKFVTNTFINLYYYYMEAKFYQCDISIIDDCLSALRSEPWIETWYKSRETWQHAVSTVKAGAVYEDRYIAFYKEDFYSWCEKLFKGDNQ